MIHVQCPSCASDYDLDERRLPASGTTMRCPACGHRFRVTPDGKVGAADDTGAVPSPPRPPAPPPPPVAPLGGSRGRPGAVEGVALDDDGDEVLDLDPSEVESVPPGASLAGGTRGGDPDLPAPKSPGRAAGPTVDLPAPRHGLADLPAPAAGGGGGHRRADEADLPALRRGAVLADGGGDLGDADLPTPVRPAQGVGQVDLPAPRPLGGRAGVAGGGASGARPPDSLDPPGLGGGVDLPAPRRGGGADLPAPKVGGRATTATAALDDLDLPMPKSGVDLPAAKGNGAPGRPADDDLDLPTPRAAGGGAGAGDWRGAAALDDLDLPMPKAGEVDLPRAQGASDLPGTRGAPADQGFGPDDLDLPLPEPRGDLPGPDRPATAVPPAGDPARGGSASGGEAFGDLDLSPPSPAGAAGPTGADGPPADSLDLPEFDMALPGPDRPVSSMPPKRPSAPAGGGAGAPKAGAGGMDFGAIDLGGEVGDEMEFADLPEEGELDLGGPPGMPSLASVGPRPGTGTRRVAAAPADQSAGRVRVPRIVWALTALVGLACVVGVGLGWTPYGYFGRYFLERFLPAAGNVAVAEGAISRAETLAKTDTYEDVRQALALLAKERREYGLNRRLLARSLLHEHLYRARFGQDAASQSRAAAIAARLEERGGQAFGYDLARAAGALVDGRYGEAGGLLGRAARAAPRDPYVPLVQGELALATGDPEAAREAFKTALELGGEARAGWGVARALLALDDGGAIAAGKATLAASPRHVAARTALARDALGGGRLDEALRLAREAAGRTPVDGERLVPSPRERPEALAVLGRVQEARGNRVAALRAFEESLEGDPYAVEALLGAGRVLLRDGRERDALARFQAVLDRRDQTSQAAGIDGRPALVEAQFGAADAMIRAGMRNEAKTALTPLLAARPDDPLVHLWMGRAHQALEDWSDAERELREAVRLDPDAYAPLLALARLFFAQEREDQAERLLDQARQNSPEDASLHRAIGDLLLDRKEVERAAGAYAKALELDPDDVAARFGRGVALRRAGRYGDAARAFDQVAARDPGWPGLAIERGRLFEAQGQAEDAVQAYRKALADRPGDPDLLLRLGAAQTIAGELDAAAETLQRVLVERPRSAEAEHFLGRVAFGQDDLPTALTHFERALQFDRNPAEFHLHFAWAALEANRLGEAFAAIDEAIERDDTLPLAYWVRGRINLKGGAAADARRDFERALEMDPDHHEVYTDLGDAFDQLRRLPEAIRAYERALTGDRSQPRWWYRLGRLNLDAGRRREAELALEKATRLGEPLEPTPPWLADAYRLYGDTLRLGGSRLAAVEQYQRYLAMAPASAFDRAEVQDWVDAARAQAGDGDGSGLPGLR